MKLLLLTILLAAAFIGGYYIAQQPGSPDLAGLVDQGQKTLCDSSGKAAESQSQAAAPQAKAASEWDPAFEAGK